MGGRIFWTGALAFALVLGGTPANAKKPTPCPGGSWEVDGVLIGGGSGSDTIGVDGKQLTIGSGCEATKAKRKVTGKFTVLQAHWKTCGTDKGVALTVKLDNATCQALTGVFKKKKSAKQQLTGRLAASRITQAELDALKAERVGFHDESPEQAALDAATAATLATEDDTAIDDFLAGAPSEADHYTPGTDPSDTSLATSDDDNYLHSITDSEGTQSQVTTLGRHAQKALIAGALTNYPTLDNQMDLYGDIYDWYSANVVGNQIETPDAIRALGASRAIAANNSLISDLFGNFDPSIYIEPAGGTPPVGYPSSCAAEEGAGDGTDRTGAVCSHKAGGVYANKKWPLKFFATCVKNQASRGTCVSFAMNGAVELMAAKKYGHWVNLSEQYLYYMAKAVWWPSSYGDGLGTHDVWQRQITTGFTTPLELDWDYNPSNSRTANNTTKTYTHSCTGYGGDESSYCSDTNHQGHLFCIDILFLHQCFAFPPPVVSAQSFHPTFESELWDSSNVPLSFAKIILAVAIFQKPVMLGIPVTPSFDANDANGYLHYIGPHCPVVKVGNDWVCQAASGCECDRGGHAVLVTGFIDNTQLPAGAPAGAGGGYLIVKNSWGACWADAGYIYIPYQWIKDMTYSATTLDIN
ncbi:MAG: C1 family peptidase [Candidatus Binatia bacterium]